MKKNLFQKILAKTDQHEGLILLLCFHILLRIPNLFEPYWYGDEAIYLTLGSAMRHGRLLYQGIIDHKTPLIYYFAMLSPSQLWFRILLMGWMSVAIWCLFQALKNLQFDKWQRIIATGLFIIFTTLPWLEGNIPNGELFVSGFIFISFWLLTKTPAVQKRFAFPHKNTAITVSKKITWSEQRLLLLSGVAASLGVLTKVPAILDVAGLMFGLLVLFWSNTKLSFANLKKMVRRILLIGIGFAIPMVLSFGYFIFRGAGQAYIDFALLYNFHYVGNWNPPFSQPELLWLFSLQGKVAMLLAATALMFFLRKKLHPLFQWLFVWSLASLVGSVLSLRPYPHYFIQVIPPLAILVGALSHVKIVKFGRELASGTFVLVLAITVFVLLQFRPYPTVSYYFNFAKVLTGQISQEKSGNTFDAFVADNRIAAAILASGKGDQTFIWGTNPMLYAQSGKIPVGRFTVAFHIADFPGAFNETIRDLEDNPPQYIVVMKNESIVFPRFESLLTSRYIPYRELEHMTIYRQSRLSQLLN